MYMKFNVSENKAFTFDFSKIKLHKKWYSHDQKGLKCLWSYFASWPVLDKKLKIFIFIFFILSSRTYSEGFWGVKNVKVISPMKAVLLISIVNNPYPCTHAIHTFITESYSSKFTNMSIWAPASSYPKILLKTVFPKISG